MRLIRDGESEREGAGNYLVLHREILTKGTHAATAIDDIHCS